MFLLVGISEFLGYALLNGILVQWCANAVGCANSEFDQIGLHIARSVVGAFAVGWATGRPDRLTMCHPCVIRARGRCELYDTSVKLSSLVMSWRVEYAILDSIHIQWCANAVGCSNIEFAQIG